MKNTTKTTLALVFAACLVPLTASADTLLGVYVGAQGWNMDAEGSFGSTANQAKFNFDTETQGSFYIALEHPLPLVPNIRIKHNQMDTQGSAKLTSTFVFDDSTYSVDSSLATQVDLTNTDFIFYYEVLDNDLISLDFGLNVKRIDGQLDVRNLDDVGQSSSEAFTGYVPMVYGAVKVGVPIIPGLGVFAGGSLLSVGDHSLFDYEIGVDYTFVDNVVVDMSLQLGYKSTQLELDDLDDIYSDLEFDGVFAGLEIHF